jgi:hypothetical protein
VVKAISCSCARKAQSLGTDAGRLCVMVVRTAEGLDARAIGRVVGGVYTLVGAEGWTFRCNRS